jgi:hypothetical protein
MIDIKDVRVKEAWDKAVVSTINKLLLQERTVIIDHLSKKYNIKKAVLRRPGLIIVHKATWTKKVGWLQMGSARLSLTKIGTPRETTRGVQVTIKKTTVIPGVFIATMESGHEGVFRRLGPKTAMKRGRYVGDVKQQIFEVMGPNIAQLFGSKETTKVFESTVSDKFPKILEHEFQFYLMRQK